MRITVSVESRLSGSSAGHAELSSDTSETVDSLIAAFCVGKGIRQSRHYVLRNVNDDVLDPTRTLELCDVRDGDTLYLTNPKEEILGFNNWYVMAAVAFFIMFVGLVAVSILYSYNGSIPESYGIVFDAGSTHTAMTVYSWAGAKLNNTGTPEQIHVCSMAGLVGYVDEKKMETDLKNCLNEGKSYIPGGKVGTTSLFLGATAGMRLLRIQNQTSADKIMQSIDKTFLTSGFYYQTGMASIIDGSVEGADAWTTTNYAGNILTSTNHDIPTYGTLDLGGASTQFAVAVQAGSSLHSNTTVEYLELYGEMQNVSVNSYLCFGQVQAYSRHLAQLTEDFKASQPIYDPCLPKGYNRSVPLSKVFSSYCTWPNSVKPVNTTTNVTFVGTSNSSQCFSLVAGLFNRPSCQKHYNYSQCFDNADLGGLQQNFIAISGFYELVHILNLTQPNLTEYMIAVNSLCSASWPQVQYYQKHLVGSVTSLAEWYCFEGTYAGLLLTTGYNFNETTWAKYLTFQNTMNKMDLGWALGFMINATNQIPAENPVTVITQLTFIFLIIIFIIFLFLSVAFGVHAWRKSSQTRGYQRLSQQYGTI